MSQWLAERSASILGTRTSRRGFLVKTALAGTALAVNPFRFVLEPGTAYGAICGCAGSRCDCGSLCCDGYTDFCCVIKNGQNSCPPGTFEAGWWRADGSAFCNGPRYYVDCNNTCDNSCACGCALGDCGHRRVCCNDFRYGNCHEEIACAGTIACRVVTCTPPYELFPCSTTTLYDNATANHTASCAPAPPAPPVAANIVSAHSGRVLDVVAGSPGNGARVVQWGSHGGNNQRWSRHDAGASLVSGAGLLQPTIAIVAFHSGKVLDVAGGSTGSGAPIIQWTWHGGTNQRWVLRPLGAGLFGIQSAHSGLFLDVSGGSTSDGAAVIQWPWHGGPNQWWRLA